MKKILSIAIICFIFVQPASSQDSWELPEGFKTKLKSGAIFFVEPTVEVNTEVMIERRCYTMPALDNTAMHYDLAMHSKLADLEIRYIINLVDSGQAVDTVSYHNVVEKIADSVLSPLTTLSQKIVNEEFNADWGLTCTINVDKKFQSKYKHAIFLALRKDQVGWIYIVFLVDEFNETVNKEIGNVEIFHALKFRN